MKIIFELENVRVIENTDADGDTQRELFIGPPFDRVQGVMKLDRNRFHVQEFTKKLTYGALCVPTGIRSALFLGLGAGIAIQAVRDRYPEAQIDVVDLNRDLFEAAHNCFFNIDANNVELFHEDAYSFVKKSTKKYDYICCDIWSEILDIPKFVTSSEFSNLLKSHLNENGLYSINTQRTVQKELTESLTQDFKFVFSLHGHNCVLLAANSWPKFISDEETIANYLAMNIDIKFIQDNMILIQSIKMNDLLEKREEQTYVKKS